MDKQEHDRLRALCGSEMMCQREADKFIAAARNALPALLDALDAAEEKAEETWRDTTANMVKRDLYEFALGKIADVEAERDALREKLEFLRSKGMTVGVARESGKEPYLAYSIEPDSHFDDTDAVHRLIDMEHDRDTLQARLDTVEHERDALRAKLDAAEAERDELANIVRAEVELNLNMANHAENAEAERDTIRRATVEAIVRRLREEEAKPGCGCRSDGFTGGLIHARYMIEREFLEGK